MMNDDIVSMVAFHTTTLVMVDLEFAKSQLELMVGELYLHPNGHIHAYGGA